MEVKNKRFSFVVDRETEERILALRARKEYSRYTLSELVRMLIAAGLEESKK